MPGLYNTQAIALHHHMFVNLHIFDIFEIFICENIILQGIFVCRILIPKSPPGSNAIIGRASPKLSTRMRPTRSSPRPSTPFGWTSAPWIPFRLLFGFGSVSGRFVHLRYYWVSQRSLGLTAARESRSCPGAMRQSRGDEWVRGQEVFGCPAF